MALRIGIRQVGILTTALAALLGCQGTPELGKGGLMVSDSVRRRRLGGGTIVLFAAVLLGGCTSTATSGKPFLEGSVATIRTGSTTTADVMRMLGEPFSKNVSADGNEMWIYSYTESTQKGAPGLYDMWFPGTQTVASRALTIRFSKDKVADCTLMKRDSSASGTMVQRSTEIMAGGTNVETKCG